jgi:hypothetical protein
VLPGLSTATTRRSSSQYRGSETAERHDAQPHDPESGAQAGNFSYAGGDGQRAALARPTASSPRSIRPSPGPERHPQRDGEDGSIADTDGNLQRYSFNVPVQSTRHYPTAASTTT